jgi:hypothetical protein
MCLGQRTYEATSDVARRLDAPVWTDVAVVDDEDEQAEQHLIIISEIAETHKWLLAMLKVNRDRGKVCRLLEKTLVALNIREGL